MTSPRTDAATLRSRLARPLLIPLVALVALLALAALALSLTTGAPSTAVAAVAGVAGVAAAAETPAQFPGADSLPDSQYGDTVRLGYRLFTDTPREARRFSGNSLSCSNCHLDAGRRPGAAPMSAAWGMYPAYQAKTDRVVTIEDRIQQCFRFSMNGLPPPLDSREVRALSAYIQFLARGTAVGVSQPGRGFPTVPRTGNDPDPLRGKALFAGRCASCHGAHGDGRPPGSQAQAFPPIWGYDSFTVGAGMHRPELLAGFLKGNMPLGNPNLSDQEALDIAAWITLQARWPDPRKGLLTGLLE